MIVPTQQFFWKFTMLCRIQPGIQKWKEKWVTKGQKNNYNRFNHTVCRHFLDISGSGVTTFLVMAAFFLYKMRKLTLSFHVKEKNCCHTKKSGTQMVSSNKRKYCQQWDFCNFVVSLKLWHQKNTFWALISKKARTLLYAFGCVISTLFKHSLLE